MIEIPDYSPSLCHATANAHINNLITVSTFHFTLFPGFNSLLCEQGRRLDYCMAVQSDMKILLQYCWDR